MRNRYLLGAGVALAVALSWADARAQLLAMPRGPGALYFGIEGGWTNLEDAKGRVGAISFKQKWDDGFNVGARAGYEWGPWRFEEEYTYRRNGLDKRRETADRLDAVCDEIAATGYALTLGIHSRIDDTVRHILRRLGIGNSYINRTTIGAVVGVQPFGGERLSGTGPKAGGPRYLHRFATERTLSIDTTAAGGNAALLSLNDQDS